MTKAISRTSKEPLLPAAQDADVSLSFRDNSSLRTAAWAVQAFGPMALADWYYDEEHTKDRGRKNQAELTGGELDERAQKVGHDLFTAIERIGRGYKLGDMPVKGAMDSAVVLGALEAAARARLENMVGDNDFHNLPESNMPLKPGGPSEASLHFQANARWMLDNVIKVDGSPDRSQDYIV